MAAGLVLAFAWLMWQLRREQRAEPKDPAVVRLPPSVPQARRHRPAAPPHEGAEGYAARVGRARPDLAAAAAALCESYRGCAMPRRPHGTKRPEEFIAVHGVSSAQSAHPGSRRGGGKKVLP